MQAADQQDPDYALAVAVITPRGTYPDGDNYHRANGMERVESILHMAAQRLDIKATSDWVVFANNREIHPGSTFADSRLHGAVELEWHKREGGGGA